MIRKSHGVPEKSGMLNFRRHQEDARGKSSGLCFLLVLSVVGTIVVSAVALAAVAVVSTHAYLSAATNIAMPFSHWRDLFLHRFIESLVLSMLAVAGVAIYKSLQ